MLSLYFKRNIKREKPEFQIIILFNKPDSDLDLYKERCQSETAFMTFKTSWFNIEDTWLTELEMVEKLFAL